MKINKFNFGLIVALTLFFASLGSSAVVINSQNWVDVQAGMQYADEVGEDPYFTRTNDGSAVLNDLPIGVNATVLQSSQNAYLPNLDAQIRTRDYDYNTTVTFDSNLELIPEDTENYVVISADRPSDVIPAAPLANAIDGWLIVVDNDVDQVEQELQDANQVIKLGQFEREENQVLDPLATETITGENRFDLSNQIADRIAEETEVDSAKLSGGRYLESSIFTESTPVLLTASNSLSTETRDYILNSTSINGVVAIGAELGTVAQELDSQADQAGSNVSVFVKYGQATTGGSREVQALSLFPLPSPNMDLQITSAQFIPEQDLFLATLRNPSDTDGFARNSIVIDNDGETEATLEDGQSRFMPADSTQVFRYNLSIDEETALASQAEFTTSYGVEENNLGTFVESREEDIFGPPRTLPISTIDLDDESNLSIARVSYDTEGDRFNVTLNNSETTAYARVNVRDVVVDGIDTTLSSATREIAASSQESFLLDANLSRDDIEETGSVTVNARYGESESFLINTDTRVAQLEVPDDESGTSFLEENAVLIVLIILLVLLIAYLVFLLVKDEDDDEEEENQ